MENLEIIEDKINHIKDAILKYVPAKYIYLFGSFAYGEPTDDSDIDVYAVVPDEVEFNNFIWADIQTDLFNKDILNVDLFINPESKFNYRKTRSLFEEVIINKGKLIYEFS